MNDLKFFYPPNSEIILEATSTTINKFHYKYLNTAINEINANTTYKMLFKIQFRKCMNGEYYNSDSKT